MNNLKAPLNYQSGPATITAPMQSGGRGYNHKKRCKCPLCKKRGGGDGQNDNDIEMGISSAKEKMDEPKDIKSETNDKKGDFNYASDKDYDELDAIEKGEGGPFKVGGTRRRKRTRKSRKSRKTRKTRKSRRTSRKGRKQRR